MANKLGATTNCYRFWSLERALAGIAGVGLKYVELGAVPGHCEHVVPERMDERDYADLLRLLRDYGLMAFSISGHSNLVEKAGMEQLKRRLDLASKMGVPIVNTGTGHAVDEESKEKAYENIMEIADYAEKLGIVVALETHGGGLTGTGEECLAAMQRINRNCVRINYDPANVVYYKGGKPEEDIKHILNYVAHVHVKDNRGGKDSYDFPAIGEGDIDFKLLFDGLASMGFSGPYSFEIELEPETPEEEDEVLRRSIEHLRKIGFVWE